LDLSAEMPAALEAVVRLDSSETDACRALAELRLKAGDYGAATALYRRVTAARDGDAEAWARYGDALEGAKRNPEALKAWDKAYVQGDRHPYTLYGIARLRRGEGSLPKAEAVLEDLVSLQPENDEACAWLAELALAQNKLQKAEEMFYQAAHAAPEKIAYVEGLGEIYLRRADGESALELLEPAKPRLTDAGRLVLAEAYRVSGKPEAALPLFWEVHQKQPTARSLTGLADAMLDRNKPLDARRQIEGSTFAKDPEVQLRLGKAHLALHDRDKAANLFQEMVKGNKENPVYLYHLALAHYQQKKNGEALKGFQRVLEKRPDMAGASYHAGMLLMAAGRMAEARGNFYALAQNVAKPDRAMGLRGLAAACLTEGKPSEASDYLVQAADVFPTPWVLAELSEVSLALYRTKHAV